MKSKTHTKDEHVLKPSKSKPFPQTFYFVDTETKLTNVGKGVKLHSLRLGYCERQDRIDDTTLKTKTSLVFYSQIQFIEWFIGQQKTKSHVYLVSHNIVYDATILDLFRLLPEHGYKLENIYSKGQTCIVGWKNGTSKITMLDNGNIFAGSLEKWGKVFNIPKLSIDFDTCTKAQLETYCKRDVKIMVKAWNTWIQFIDDHDCGGFRQTIGSTAFNTWRHRFMHKNPFVHKDQTVLTLERNAYHGGRVEAFYQGTLWTDHYYYLDINNMYGFVMQNHEYPIGLQGYSNTLGLRRMISYLSRYAVVARVTVNVDEPAFITKVNGHAAYPLGRFETCLTTHELEYALRRGWLEDVKEFAWYLKAELFGGLVGEFYKLRMKYREEKNTGYEAICKIIINSLYGKFGQTGIKQVIIGKAAPNEIWKMPVIHAQSNKQGEQVALGGVIYESYPQGESYHSMPVIAAHVTANARLYLLSLIQTAGWQNVYYCDTDSIIVNQDGYNAVSHLIDENTLGKLKVETHSPYLIVNAPKDYEMIERKRIKGVRENAIALTDNDYKQEQWVKLNGLIHQNFAQGYTSKEIIKHQKRVIYSGQVLTSGLIVPFEL